MTDYAYRGNNLSEAQVERVDVDIQHQSKKGRFPSEYQVTTLPNVDGVVIRVEDNEYILISELGLIDLNDVDIVNAMYGTFMESGMIVDFHKVGKCVFLSNEELQRFGVVGLREDQAGYWIFLNPKLTQKAFSELPKLAVWRQLAGIEA